MVGAGVRRTVLSLAGETEEDTNLRGAIDFGHKLTATTQACNKFLVESGSDNTFLQNQLGVDFAVRHSTDVLPGTDETDQVLSMNLVYGF